MRSKTTLRHHASLAGSGDGFDCPVSAQPTETSTSHTPHCYLIRHSAVAVPPGICYGQSDVALLEPVEALAASLRARLPSEFTLLASPLTRCRQLAEALGAPRYDARLREIDFGTWEMRSWDEIGRDQLDAWAADPLGFCGHGGESVTAMATRAVAALSEALERSPGPLVIVSHGGPLRALRGHLQGLPASQWSRLEFAPGELQQIARPAGSRSTDRGNP